MFKAEQVSDETAPCGCRMIRHVYKEMPGLTLVTGHDCDKRPVQAWEIDWHDGFIFDMDVALRIYDKRPKVVHAEEHVKGTMPVHGVVSGSIRPVLQSIQGGKE